MPSAPAGPSRSPARGAGQSQVQPPPAPSTSGDSESTAAAAGLLTDRGLDVGLLKELARTTLVEKLNDIPGAKTLILEPGLAGPLGLVTEVALLKHQAVDKMFWLERGPLNASTRNVVWLCRPKISNMRIIAEQIRNHHSSGSGSAQLTFTILLVPRATELCRKVLEDEGVAGDVTISEYKLEFIPIEDDLLSLEMPDVARDVFLNGDDTPVYQSSLALMTFQRAFGLFPRILGKGDAAKRLCKLLQRHHSSGASKYADLELSDQVDSLIILDRAVDWVTPMCTQLTYEGMLDEHIGIHNAHIEIDPALIDPSAAPAAAASSSSGSGPTASGQNGLSAVSGGVLPTVKKRKHHLSAATDRLLAEIRDVNFAVVGPRLSRVARRLESDYGGAKNLKSVSEMKQFVGKLGGLQGEQQGLRLHTGLMEQLMPITRTDEFNKNLEAQQNLIAGYDPTTQFGIVEDLLAQQSPWATVLRSAVLASLTSGGIKPKPLEAFKRDFLQSYGYHHLPLLIALQDLGLLLKSPSTVPHPFPSLRKSLRLVVDDTDDARPNDISYVYSGYAPLSVRLVQCVTQKNAIGAPSADAPPLDEFGAAGQSGGGGSRRNLPRAHPIGGWKGFEDVLASIPGATFDERQKAEQQARADPASSGDRTATTVVFFLGGCTYTEISALRWMSKQTKGRRFLVATTGIINGSSLLESFGDSPPVPLSD